jgi:hypothetical protein
MRRFNVLPAKHAVFRSIGAGQSDDARVIEAAKFVAALMGVCIFLTVSRFPGALSKRVALELIENENGRTASEILQRGHCRKARGENWLSSWRRSSSGA